MKVPRNVPVVIRRRVPQVAERPATPPSVPPKAPKPASLQQPGVEGLIARLAALRARADITLKEQDRLAGLTVNYSHTLEAGRVSRYITARTVAAFARLYGTTMDYLFLGVGEPPTDAQVERAVTCAFATYEAIEDKIDALKDQAFGGI